MIVYCFIHQALKQSTSMESEASEHTNLGVWTCMCWVEATTGNPVEEVFSFSWIRLEGLQPAREKMVSPFSFSLVHMSLASDIFS